ncbi:TIGR04086 family membrane protein [Oscillochloris sp. ZM17-4]|uniref:TIGR04086 family membrane protein n=1 Tax=Oscillochloris sp. ZM17-4 TaxID=2866714 RepID=UPI001C73A300|nr:TIGR04086 family membrane protein [Oscillochloris sp. ZM17-4]MBX0327998.1 TIGR04086 family membrane protein [Oscillochloris sp. ZM17-4]
MNIRWAAVLFGWLVDFGLSLALQLLVIAVGATSFFDSPSFTSPTHLVIMLLFVLVVGAGGFAAARMAGTAFALHGFLVGVADILFSTLLSGGVATPRPFILIEILGCAAGALGGLLAMRLRRAS